MAALYSCFSVGILGSGIGIGRGAGGPRPPWILKILTKKLIFVVSSGKKQI